MEPTAPPSRALLNVATLALSLMAQPGLPAEPAPILLRHFQQGAMARIETGRLPCCFDHAVDYGQQQFPRSAHWLRAAGKGRLVYFNVHDVQPEVVRGEWPAPWNSFVADTVMGAWGAYLVSESGDTARYFAYGGEPYLINWAVIDSTRAEHWVAAQKAAAGDSATAFWDVYFPELAPWMFHDKGASYTDFPAVVGTRYRENFERALRIARRAFKSEDPSMPWDVLVNGSWHAPPPLYLEGSEQSPLGSFDDAREIWRRHPANVLSVRAHHTAWVDSLIGTWLAHGGVIAFTDVGDQAMAEARAYEKAEAARRRLARPARED